MIMQGAGDLVDRDTYIYEPFLEAYCVALSPRFTTMDARRWAPLCSLGEYSGRPGDCAIDWCKGPSGHLWFYCAHTSCKFCLLLIQIRGYQAFVVRVISWRRFEIFIIRILPSLSFCCRIKQSWPTAPDTSFPERVPS